MEMKVFPVCHLIAKNWEVCYSPGDRKESKAVVDALAEKANQRAKGTRGTEAVTALLDLEGSKAPVKAQRSTCLSHTPVLLAEVPEFEGSHECLVLLEPRRAAVARYNKIWNALRANK
jgi:hypothetical protein